MDPIKRQRFSDRIQKTSSNYILPTGDILYIQRYKYSESSRMEKIYYANSNHKKAGLALLISEKNKL